MLGCASVGTSSVDCACAFSLLVFTHTSIVFIYSHVCKYVHMYVCITVYEYTHRPRYSFYQQESFRPVLVQKL